MFCSKCGNNVQENQKFCSKCGNKIESYVSKEIVNEEVSQSQQVVGIPQQTQKSKKSTKHKKWLIIVGSIFLAVVIIVVSCYFVLNNDTPSAKDDSDDNATYSDNSSVIKTSDKAFITSISDISGGIAKATLETDKGVSYDAIIDTKGNVKYICKQSEHFIYAPTTPNDIGCVGTKDESTYKLINGEGKVIKTCDGSEFDELLAIGDGYALVYKYQATIDSETHLYGVINNTGEWAIELTDFGQEPFRGYENHYSSDSEIWADYVGSNVFDVRVGYSGGEHMLINASTGKVFWVYLGWSGYNDYNKDISFEDGVHYVVCNYSGSYYHAFVSDIPLRANGEINGDSLDEKKERYRTAHDFKLYPDGTWKVLTKQSEDGYQNITLDYPAMNGYEKAGDKWIKTSGDYIAIYDQDKKTIAPFAEYKSSMISGINFDGDYSIVKITGTDRKSYFTVINSIGEMQFEPMVYSGSTPTCSSEKVVYTNSNGKYIIADTSGNVIAKDLDFEYIDEFCGDIAKASKNGKIYLINSKGTILVDDVRIPKK